LLRGRLITPFERRDPLCHGVSRDLANLAARIELWFHLEHAMPHLKFEERSLEY
jgi:hypothetical protein